MKSHGNHIVIFSDEKTFTVDLVMNKQDGCVVSFSQDVSEIRYMSMTKHPASMMMLGIMASNEEKILPV